MRSGQVVRVMETVDTTAVELAREMLGREVSLRAEAAALGLIEEAGAEAVAGGDADAGAEAGADADSGGRVVLRVRDARARAADGRWVLDGLSIDLREGEILGLAGVEGNGQTALGRLMSNLLALESGSVEVDGRPVPDRPGAMLQAGVGVVPEDRHESGCILDMTVAENLALTDLDDVCSSGFVSSRLLRERAAELIRRFDIKTPSPDTPMRLLSGGNQQRVVLARELSRAPRILVAAQPTRGLDVGAIEYVTEQLQAAAASGIAVLLISTELEEILAVSDRIAVIHRGRIMGIMRRGDVDVERLGLMMGGQQA
jgi:simple sugar transport system ATP-binding protein